MFQEKLRHSLGTYGSTVFEKVFYCRTAPYRHLHNKNTSLLRPPSYQHLYNPCLYNTNSCIIRIPVSISGVLRMFDSTFDIQLKFTVLFTLLNMFVGMDCSRILTTTGKQLLSKSYGFWQLRVVTFGILRYIAPLETKLHDDRFLCLLEGVDEIHRY